MRKVSGPLLFLAGLLVVLAVAGGTFLAVKALDLDEDDVAAGGSAVSGDGDGGEATDEPVLQDDQVAVTGIATGITIEGATFEIPTPIVVNTAERGVGGGVLTDVEVDGELTDVAWDAGRPFDLQGAGGITPQAMNLYAAPTAITVGFVDDLVNELVPGSYGLETPVAIGRGGLARSQQAVAFEATVESTLVFRGGATTAIPPRALSFQDGGHVLIEGTLQVRRPDGTVTDVTGIDLPEGEYRLTATPRADGTGYDVEALLQGAVNVI